MELEEYLTKIDKKLDKILKMTTTIAKTLHIVPVSEKEEREIQLLQRKNVATIQKVQDEIANLEQQPEDTHNILSFADIVNADSHDIYADILGDDYNFKEEK